MSRLSHNAILAKTHAMYGKRITKEQYDAMMKCHSVSEVAGFLKTQTHFKTALANIAENNIHRGQLENLLHRAVFEDYSKLYRYLFSKQETFSRYVIEEEEIREILRMVLLMKADNAKSFILDLPGYLISHSSVDLMAVAHSNNFEELIHVLENTPYSSILKRFRPTEDRPFINYVGCEHAFYEYFFRHMTQDIKKSYKGLEQKRLLDLLNLRIELLNLSHIMRSKTYLNTSNSDIVRSLFPYYYKLTSKDLMKMIEAKDSETLNQLFYQTPYCRQFSSEEFPYVEDYTNRVQYRSCRRALHFSTHSSVAFYSYIVLSQLELSNVINIIEGIRYQISESEMRKLIVFSD